MYRVVIADDEPIIMKGLKKLIKWQEEGFTIVGEANNGEELWQQTLDKEPELVITDISMPKMTGIDYIKELRNKGLATNVLFISAYEDFSYAKDAIKYGAKGYVIKPIDKVNLRNEIKRIKQGLDENKINIQEKEQLVNLKNKDNEKKFLEGLQHIADGSPSLNHYYQKEMTKAFTNPRYTIISISYDDNITYYKKNAKWNEKQERLLLFSIRNVLQDLLTSFDVKLFQLEQTESSLLFLVNHNNTEDVLNLAQGLCKKLKDLLEIHIFCGIGDTVKNVNDVRLSKTTALFHAQYYYFVAPDQIITKDILPEFNRKVSAENLTENRELLYHAILKQHHSEWQKAIDTFFEWLVIISAGNKDIVVSTCFSILSELKDAFRKIGVNINPDQKNITLFNKLHQLRTFQELRKFFMQLAEYIQDELEKQEDINENYQLKTVLQYIEQHYYHNITLDSMANRVHMNPYYFSSFFKKHTGENFKKYLTKIRMDNAMNLLLNSDLLIYEIAEEVGYRNVRQFSDMFKKYFGKLPTNYRQAKLTKKT